MTNTGLIKDNGKFLIPFLLNKDDAEKYTCKSNQKIWFVCPKCGYKSVRGYELKNIKYKGDTL